MKGSQTTGEYKDVHNTLMAKYPEGRNLSQPGGCKIGD